jgi:hypothetical protein
MVEPAREETAAGRVRFGSGSDQDRVAFERIGFESRSNQDPTTFSE